MKTHSLLYKQGTLCFNSKLITLLICSLLVFSCKKEEETSSSNSFRDSRDNKVYKKITIGTQTWMGENLAYLPEVSSGSSYTDPHYYVYGYSGTSVSDAKEHSEEIDADWDGDGDGDNERETKNMYDTYGVLYNWEAAKDACPSGWHLPSDGEWTTLTDYVGGSSNAGRKLKSTLGWDGSDSEDGNGIDAYGFSALPGGFRYSSGSFNIVGKSGYWWSAMPSGSDKAWRRGVNYISSNVYRYSDYRSYGFSVRCFRD